MPDSALNVLPKYIFPKFSVVTKMSDNYRMPRLNADALMDMQRKNIGALAAINQSLFENIQAFAYRQSELVRRGLIETTSLMNDVISSRTPQEKIICQAEVTKIIIEKYMANMRDAIAILSDCSNQAMQKISARMTDNLQEMRNLMRTEVIATE